MAVSIKNLNFWNTRRSLRSQKVEQTSSDALDAFVVDKKILDAVSNQLIKSRRISNPFGHYRNPY